MSAAPGAGRPVRGDDHQVREEGRAGAAAAVVVQGGARASALEGILGGGMGSLGGDGEGDDANDGR